MNITKMISDHITTIHTEKKILIIFRGFNHSFLSQIEGNKLLDSPLTITLEDLNSMKAALIPQLFAHSNDKEFYWCTTEESMVVGQELLGLYFSIVPLRNNLYDKTYPVLYNLDISMEDLQRIVDDETESNDNGDERMGLLYQYYGNIRDIRGRIYVTYPDIDDEAIPFYPETIHIPELELSTTVEVRMELSENEDNFLQLVNDILEGSLPEGDIYIALSGDLNATPHRYVHRLQALQGVTVNRYVFRLVQKQTIHNPGFDEEPYLDVLKRYWNHRSFRTLKMYKNIKNRTGDKTTTEISQGQIVDDIVQEVLKAKKGDDYRDIFVTSPTGAGKSVMFQVPAIYLAEKYKYMTIVISPLIGLMNDQVQGLRANHVDMSATINSEISPVEKMEIRNQIQEGKVSILYISPETLLSRSDIAMLIGEREVGLFVIDEAHIVTTWGKAFRSDYWYLGTYLAKLRKEINFPIATFTATAIYGGIEDMYVETRDSLNLITPISYFGYIRRDNLEISIKRKLEYEKRFSEYLMDKNKILLNRIEQFVKSGHKTLVYFPTVKAILNFKEFSRVYGSEAVQENLTIYYGPLEKENKQENYLRYKNNEALIMLATKAFGMGIDIPDIHNVYHFAPTGNVCDYVQEIGRAARKLDQGFAYFDFLPQDFVHVQRLHGISTIKKGQLIQVIRKILAIMDEQKGNNIRNLLVSADEFRYIFQDGGSRENDDIDNKIKTALLIIEKDFQAKLTYSPIVARPRSVFAREYFIVPSASEHTVFPVYSRFFDMQNQYGEGAQRRSIYQVDLKGIWQEHYQNMSFPEFKYHFHSKETRVKLPFKGMITPVMQIQLNLKADGASALMSKTEQWVDRINTILGRFAKTKQYFDVQDLTKELQQIIGGTKYAVEMVAEIIIDSSYTFDRLMRQSNNFYNRFLAFDESRNKYHLLGTGYAGFTEWILQETHAIFQQPLSRRIGELEYEIYFPKLFGSEQEKRFIYLGLMESLGLVMYRVNGGDNPEIFIRINSRTQLERTINNPTRYKNLILENVRIRHNLSVAMLKYIFENQVDTQRFWDLIEDYFLGRIPEEVMQRIGL